MSSKRNNKVHKMIQNSNKILKTNKKNSFLNSNSIAYFNQINIKNKNNKNNLNISHNHQNDFLNQLNKNNNDKNNNNKFVKIFKDDNNSKKIDSNAILKSHKISSSNNLNETSSSSYQQINYEEFPSIKINAFNDYFHNDNKFKGKIQFSSKKYFQKLNKFKNFRNKMEQSDYWKNK
jgi:hypothetical protein